MPHTYQTERGSHMFRTMFSALVAASGPTARTQAHNAQAHNARVRSARHDAERGCAR